MIGEVGTAEFDKNIKDAITTKSGIIAMQHRTK